MEKLKTAKGDWVVVCDGKKALILENVGDATVPDQHTREVKEHPAPPRALGVLRQAYAGHVRSAIRAEVAHDYIKLPVDEIEKRLFG